MKILLADDNTQLRAFTAEVLTTAGFRVVEAADGPHASRLFDEQPCDLLVTDFDMPGFDGLVLCDRLRQHRPTLPVLVISSHCGTAPMATRSDIACLAKPFDRRRLLSAVEAARHAAPSTPSSPVHEAPVTPTPSTGRRLRGLGTGVAIAALVTLVWWRSPNTVSSPPSLPDPASSSIQRSSHLQVIAPEGVLSALPEDAHWSSLDDAIGYRVHFESVDGQSLYAADSSSNRWQIPDDLRHVLLANVAYYWQVEAVADEGKIIARSPKTRFRVLTSDPNTTSSTGNSP